MTAVARASIEDRAPRSVAAVVRRWETLLIVLLVLVFAVAGTTLNGFLDPYNLADSTFNFSEKGLMAPPMALLIPVREIDVSVAAIVAVASVAMGFANQAGVPAPGLAVIGIVVGALLLVTITVPVLRRARADSRRS